jgi:membrane-associated protein
MFDFLLHFDVELPKLFLAYGAWVYAIVFLIIFCETGLVVTPFLPGDSMLFALGAFAAQGSLNIFILLAGLAFAAVAGNSLNFAIGWRLGAGLLENPRQKFFKRRHYDKAHAFYQKHGGFAIILSRFIPVVRSFAPFVAGAARMSRRKFLVYNLIGGVLWVSLFAGGGFFLGRLPLVKGNFKTITLAIVVVSLIPAVWELSRARMKPDKTKGGCGKIT